MKIGISGASGHLGRAVLKRLADLPGDHHVIGISRSPDGVRQAHEARFGDYDAPDRLREAYAGLDRLLIIPTIDIAHGARARQLVRAIDAAVAAGVGHIVLISDVGTRDEPEPCVGAASWVGEQHLIRSAPCWTILRANYFMESYAEEVLLWQAVGHIAELGEGRTGFVSRDDVADAAAGILVGEGHRGAIYNATGPETLSPAQSAALIASVTGKPMTVVETPVEGLRQHLREAGFPEPYFGIVTDTKRKAATGGFDIVTGDVERLSGHTPIPLCDVLTRYVTAHTL